MAFDAVFFDILDAVFFVTVLFVAFEAAFLVVVFADFAELFEEVDLFLDKLFEDDLLLEADFLNLLSIYANLRVIGEGLSVTRFLSAPLVTLLPRRENNPSESPL